MSAAVSRNSDDRRTAVLVGASLAGIGLVAASVAIARMPNLAEAPSRFLVLHAAAFACYVVGVLLVRRNSDRHVLTLVLTIGVVCRLALLPALPTLSTDAYRYVWDARVAAAGVSPYRHPPVAPELIQLREENIFPRLNHPTWLTIYPPGAQAFFRAVYAVAPDSVRAMKLAVGLVEALALGLLLALLRAHNLPMTQVVIYAWNPLVLIEIWGSAHVDALVLTAVVGAALAAARGARGLAAILLGLATLAKLYPVILIPLLWRRRDWKPAVLYSLTVVAGYLPLGALGREALGSLPRYLVEEYFNRGLVGSLIDSPALTVLVVVLWVAWAATRSGDFAHRAMPLIAGAVVLAPSVFPWYAAWLVPFLAVAPSPGWIGFTGTLPFAYAFFLSSPWSIPAWARAVEVAPLVVGACLAIAHRFDISVTTAPRRVLRSLRRGSGASHGGS